MKFTFEIDRKAGTYFYTDLRIEIDDPWQYLITNQEMGSTCALVTVGRRGAILDDAGTRVTFTSKLLTWSGSEADISFVSNDEQEYASLSVRTVSLFNNRRTYKCIFANRNEVLEFRRISPRKTSSPKALKAYEVCSSTQRVALIAAFSRTRQWSLLPGLAKNGIIETSGMFSLIEVACLLQVLHFFEYMEASDI